MDGRDTTDGGTDTDDLGARLGRWMAEQPGIEDVEVVARGAPVHGGLSARTRFVDASWYERGRRRAEALVVQQEDPLLLFPDRGVARVAELLVALERTTELPVPEVRFVEADPAPLGAPFVVTRRVEGRIPSDDPPYQVGGWLAEAAPAEQAAVQRSALAALARVAAVEPTSLAVPWLTAPAGGGALEHDLVTWREYLDWAADGDRVPVVDELYAGAADAAPHRADAGLAWGDARMGNLVFGPDASVVATLDWEMATVGPAELDLGWFRFLESVAERWLERLPGFASPNAARRLAADALGRPVADLDWFERWAGVRAAAIQLRLAHRRRVGGDADALVDVAHHPVVTVARERWG